MLRKCHRTYERTCQDYIERFRHRRRNVPGVGVIKSSTSAECPKFNNFNTMDTPLMWVGSIRRRFQEVTLVWKGTLRVGMKHQNITGLEQQSRGEVVQKRYALRQAFHGGHVPLPSTPPAGKLTGVLHSWQMLLAGLNGGLTHCDSALTLTNFCDYPLLFQAVGSKLFVQAPLPHERRKCEFYMRNRLFLFLRMQRRRLNTRFLAGLNSRRKGPEQRSRVIPIFDNIVIYPIFLLQR